MSLLRLLASFRPPPPPPVRPPAGAVTQIITAYDPARVVRVNRIDLAGLRARIEKQPRDHRLIAMSVTATGTLYVASFTGASEPAGDEPTLDELSDEDAAQGKLLVSAARDAVIIDCGPLCWGMKDPDDPTTKGGHGLPPGLILARLIAVSVSTWTRIIPVTNLTRHIKDVGRG